jgi:L-rhamnose mutarotase
MGSVMSRRICMALDLKDDPQLIAEYEQFHKNVWPEIKKSIEDAGIENMDIYRTGNRLFMIMEVNDSFDPQAKSQMDRENPLVQRWESLMDQYQQRLPWAGKDEKWVLMTRIFGLNDKAPDEK